MLDLGMVRPGSTIRIPINTFSSDDPSASLSPSALVAADIEIYKDGSTTQRASDAGYVATVAFDTIVGVSVVEIDLANNTTAGFFEAGSEYIVVVGPFTLDAATINAAVARFLIGYPDAILNTTIATLASQTSFTLEEGSADASAYVGCPVIVHDLASAVQIAFGYISAYAVTTRTVTLAVDPAVFTMALGDHISIFPPSQVASWNNVPLATTNPLPNAAAEAAGGLYTRGIGAGQINQDDNGRIDANVDAWLTTTPLVLTSQQVQTSVAAMQAAVVTAAAVATDAIDADALAADAVQEIVDGLLNEAVAGHVAAGTIGNLIERLDLIATGGAGELTAARAALLSNLDAAISSLNNLSTADIDARLAAIGLDHLVATAVVGADVTDDSIFAQLVSASATADWDDFVNTTDALQALRDRGDVAWLTAPNDPTAATIAAAVWDALRAAHVIAGSFGQGVASVQGNVTGSVASVTGAVGSVTGNVGGNVAGDVQGNVDGSVASVIAGVLVAVGGIGATAFAANAIDAAALAQDAAREIADEILDRNLAGGGSGDTRNVRNALRPLRNRVAIVAGTATVFQEDDATTAWTAAITTAAGNPISEVNPAGP